MNNYGKGPLIDTGPPTADFMSDRFSKPSEYYENVRTDIMSVMPAQAPRILEVGCGAGNTLRYLKDRGTAAWVGGIELNDEAALTARERVDRLWHGDAAKLLDTPDGPASEGPYDAILCLDVLEHLVDPWALTKRLANMLAPGGAIIAVLPNIRFYKVALALLLRGEWTYEESGVLDSTHLRFFTKSTMIEMFEHAGLGVEAMEPTAHMKPWRNKWILNYLSGGQLMDIYAYAYKIRAVKQQV